MTDKRSPNLPTEWIIRRGDKIDNPQLLVRTRDTLHVKALGSQGHRIAIVSTRKRTYEIQLAPTRPFGKIQELAVIVIKL